MKCICILFPSQSLVRTCVDSPDGEAYESCLSDSSMKMCAVETTHSIEEAAMVLSTLHRRLAMVLHQPCTDGSQWCYINSAQTALKMLNVGIIARKLSTTTEHDILLLHVGQST